MAVKETTTKFKVDISELKSGIQEANRQIRLANAEFKAASSGMDDWSKSADGLNAKIKQLETVLDGETRKLDSLNSQLKLTEKEYGSNSKAADELRIKIANQQATINKTERSLSDFRNQLNDVEKGSDKGAKGLDKFEKEANEAEKSSTSLAGVLGGALKKGLVAIGAAAAGAVTGFLATGEASQEYIEDMGKLEAAFTSSGHSAETAQKAYKGMVGILGETDQSVEAVNHLAKLTKNEKELAKWTDIAAGIYATFGDSLPIEGLTEAANETAKVGKVTGPLADALNWAGINEDKFNESLAKCNSEQERATLITNTLNKTYDTAADKYKEVNADLIESRRATSDMNAAMAEMGKVAMPITTALKDGFSKLLGAIVELISGADIEGFTKAIGDGFQFIIDKVLPPIVSAIQWVIDNKDLVIAGIVGIGAAMMTLNVANMIMGLVKSFKAFKAAQEGATIAQWALNAAMLANPIGLVIAAIVGLVAAFVVLWNKSEGFRNFFINMWKNIKEFFGNAVKAIGDWAIGLWDDIKEAWSGASEWFNEKVIEPITGFFSEAWDNMKLGAKLAWEGIKSTFSNVANWFGDIFSKAWKKVKDVFSTGGKIFDGIKDGIVNAFKAVVNGIIKGINKVVAIPFNAINKILKKLKGISIAGIEPFSWVKTFDVPQIPELWQGGIAKKGQKVLLEGRGDEAVVPLHNNKKWIRKTSQDLKESLKNEGLISNSNTNSVVNNNYNFTQHNTSPKSLSRLEIYRQTKNQLLYAKGV